MFSPPAATEKARSLLGRTLVSNRTAFVAIWSAYCGLLALLQLRGLVVFCIARTVPCPIGHASSPLTPHVPRDIRRLLMLARRPAPFWYTACPLVAVVAPAVALLLLLAPTPVAAQKPPPTAETPPETTALPPVTVIGTTPLAGYSASRWSNTRGMCSHSRPTTLRTSTCSISQRRSTAVSGPSTSTAARTTPGRTTSLTGASSPRP